MAIVTGTFSGTGSSTPVAGTKISIKMDFAGTASVDIEELGHDGGWVKAETGITADSSQVFDRPTISTVRLTCTAHTNNVVYSLETN